MFVKLLKYRFFIKFLYNLIFDKLCFFNKNLYVLAFEIVWFFSEFLEQKLGVLGDKFVATNSLFLFKRPPPLSYPHLAKVRAKILV